MRSPSSIGFPKRIRAIWMDLALELAAQGIGFEDARCGLTALIRHDTPGSIAVIKTLRALKRMWFAPPPECTATRAEALELYRRRGQAPRAIFHWGMALACYPFVSAVAEWTGIVLRETGRLRTGEIIRDLGGELGLPEYQRRIVRFNLSSFADWGMLVRGRSYGEYASSSPIPISESDLVRWLVQCLLHASPGGDFSNISPPALFPFGLRGVEAVS